MAIPERGLQNIRTYAGKNETASIPYRTYMKVSCLEMERARRAKERAGALQRIKDIETRFLEIDVEKDTLLQNLERHRSQLLPDERRDRPTSIAAPKTGSFWHSY